MRKYAYRLTSIVLLAVLVLAAACGPVTVNRPSIASNRKMAFALDSKGRFTFLPESRVRSLYLSDIYGNFLTRLTAPENVSGWCDFSPANDKILYVDKLTDEEGEEQFHLKVYDLKKEKTESEFISTRFIWFPEWSPNGKYIAFCGEGRGEITVLNWRENKIVHRVKTNTVFYRWLPDASGFLTVDNLDEIESIDGGTLYYFVIRMHYFNKEEKSEDLVRGYSRSVWPDISSDGKKIVFNAMEFKGPASFLVDKIEGKEHVYLFDIETRAVRQLTKGGISAFYTVLSPDGAKVAFVDYDQDPLGGGDVWICSLGDVKNNLDRIWRDGNGIYPFWCENDLLGFVGLDEDEKMGKGFDDIYIYNLSNENLSSLKERIVDLYKPVKEESQ